MVPADGRLPPCWVIVSCSSRCSVNYLALLHLLGWTTLAELIALIEKYLALAEKMVGRLKEDPNVLAVLVYGSVATKTVSEGSDIDLLLLVKEIPEGVDVFGIKRTSVDGVPVDLAFKTVEHVSHQIEYEAGSWYASSVMLNSLILHDPEGVAESLRNKVRDTLDEHREFIFNCLMEDARTYPDKIAQSIELGDYRGAAYLTRLVFDSLVQIMFLANRTRPSSEKGMVRDFFALGSLPGGLLEAFDLIGGFDETNEEKAGAMLEALVDSIESTEGFWNERR
jgi:predicted nucleotidyltransferase